MISFYLSMIETEDDKHKFEIIYEKFHLLVYHEARKYTQNSFMIEDISQEAFLSIIKNIKTLRYDNDKEFSSLVGTITRHCAIAYLKKNNKYVPAEEIDYTLDDRDYDTEKVVVNRLAVKRVMEELAGMNPVYSSPLRLKIHGYSSAEIAAILNITPENARMRIYRAKKMIAEKLGGVIYGK